MSQYPPPIPPANPQGVPPRVPGELGYQPWGPVRTSGLAIASLVCGIVGLLGLCFAPIGIVGLVGLGLGIGALVTINGQPQRLGGKGLAIAGISTGAVSMLGMCAGAALLLPALASARQSARQVVGASNLRQIGMGLSMYAQANGDWMPETAQGWEARLMGAYVADSKAFDSPAIEGSNAGELIYVPPGKLSGLADPTSAIVVYEDPALVKGGMVSVLYADGRTGTVTKAELAGALGKQKK